MGVKRTIVLDDEQGGVCTAAYHPNNVNIIEFTMKGTVWASIPDVRKFAVELLDAYKDVAVVNED